MTPTARTLALLRRLGFLADVAERWIPGANVRRDLFGFGDVLAVHPVNRVMLIVQVTTLDHVANRLAKARGRPELATWLRAGGAFEVHGWTKRASRWEVKRVAVQADALDVAILSAPRRRRPLQKGERQGTLPSFA